MTAWLRFGDLARDAATLGDRGARLAGGLRRLGLQEGDVVATLLRNDPVFADVIHAGRIGGIYYCPLNWHFTPPEIAHILADSGAKALIGHGDLLAAAAASLPPGLPMLAVGDAVPTGAEAYEDWLAAAPAYDGPAVSPRAHMGYTSGTTGRPKGVRRFPVPPEEAAAKRAEMAAVVAATFGIVPGCRALVSAPLYHSAPSVFAQQALMAGAGLVLAPRFDAEETLALIERHRIEVAYLVPVMYVRLLRLPEAVRRRHDLSSLRFVASTGAPCAPEVKRAMIDWLGPVVTETYAATETGMVTAIGAAEALERPGSAGRPVGAAEIRILDAEGRPCPTGTIGIVHVRQPAYADFTYHGQPEARRAVERCGLITLGDMGYLDEAGYLFLCDRASDMVVSGGVNIYPAEIEHALLRIPGVLDCAVFGVPDAEFGERLHAVVQPDPGAVLAPDAIRERLRAELAGFKVPRGIEVAATLPRDDNGKIAKRHLRDAHWAGHSRRIG
jgi:long-chain acyl-CoA synthetase